MMWGDGTGWGMGWMWGFAVLLVAGAREVLDERYARGEIDTDEYQERRRALEGGER